MFDSARHTPFARLLLAAFAAAAGAVAAADAPAAAQGQRLSHWLLAHPAQAGDYPAGLVWQSAQEVPAQTAAKARLIQALGQDRRYDTLRLWLQGLPVTGRSSIALPDGIWLNIHPQQDPVLGPNDRVHLPSRPQTVTVVLENGQLCQVRHEAAAPALRYISYCTADAAARDWVWLAQPDGRQVRHGQGLWNAQQPEAPEPGAWIWSPRYDSGFSAEVSAWLSAYLASQGPAADGLAGSHRALLPVNSSTLRREVWRNRDRDLILSANDWGEIGLLQTPTARMAPAGSARIHLSHVQPYTRLSTLLQPFDWLETGFRYTRLGDRRYSNDPNLTTQSLKDKSIDLKVRLLQESRYLPAVAVGARDFGGTGLFSGEYVVANKRSGNLDFSAGLGWGYVGARGNISNPLGLLSSRFKEDRQRSSGSGGTVNWKAMFRGRSAAFAGVQWQTPHQPLSLKLEYEGNDYRHEPAGRKDLGQKTAFNFGANYRLNPYADVSMGLERGKRLMLGLTLHANAAQTTPPKVLDAPMAAIAPQAPAVGAQNADDWASTRAEIEAQTGWQVRQIERAEPGLLRLHLEDQGSTYRQEREQRLLALLHRDAPPDIDRMALRYVEHGLQLEERQVPRQAWAAQAQAPHSPSHAAVQPQAVAQVKRMNDLSAAAAQPLPDAAETPQTQSSAAAPSPAQPSAALLEAAERLHFALTPSISQSFGGPDTFLLYQLGVHAQAEWRLQENTWLSGGVNLRLLDNYDKFTYTAGSELPRVRTFIREYQTSRRLTLEHLQLSHVGQVGENHFYSLYGGLLEPMYAGVGGEWLYRPRGSRLAYGLDLNRVRQRSFEQNLRLRDYEVSTGHANIYWDTGWQDIMVKFRLGRYLAGDKGATLDLSRTFDNGVTFGAWITRTNVSSREFGEGSFDKGIYLRFPLDILLPRSSTEQGRLTWQPLLRDGGARLERQLDLYEFTQGRDRRAFDWAPAPSGPQVPQSGGAIFPPAAQP